MSCVVTFGNTMQDDGTAGTQPWGQVPLAQLRLPRTPQNTPPSPPTSPHPTPPPPPSPLHLPRHPRARAPALSGSSTVIAYNKAHEIGQYQLQSSLWFTSRATMTRAEGNVVFNIPRAAINLNDAFGGGNNMTLLSIWNSCRQSGDHGPIKCVPCRLARSSATPGRVACTLFD